MKYLRGKTWIDWVKMIVAVDIAAVGIGLIFQQQIHILAGVFGSISRIIFGILYIIVAASIFKAVFPKMFEDLRGGVTELHNDAHAEVASPISSDETKETVGEMIDKTAQKINTFVQGKVQEAKEEIKKYLGETSSEEK